MRVLRFILRFLGISAFLLWLLASIASAQDNQDVTVNFPDEMTVSGSVEITNLGINGDPYWNSDALPGHDSVGLDSTMSGLDSYNPPATYSTTYIDGYDSITIWSGSLMAQGADGYFGSLSGTKSLILKVPKFKWGFLRRDFSRALYGSVHIDTTTDQPLTQHFMPGLTGGRSNIQNSADKLLTTSVTDYFGNGSWSFDINWKAFAGLYGASGHNLDTIWMTGFDFKAILTFFLKIAAWLECIYLVVAKISQG